MNDTLKVAIIHPSFGPMGGGERFVDALAEIYPQADFFTLFPNTNRLPPNVRAERIKVSAIDALLRHLPIKPTHLLPLFPWAIEKIDLRGYDLVISSCGPAVMGVNVGQQTTHISYIHTPQRSWWDLYAEYQQSRHPLMRGFYTWAATNIRQWEFSAIQRVDHVVSNSRYIAHRVGKYFRRDSTVIYPPVFTSAGYISDAPEDYYLSVSRLVSVKRVELLIQACNQLRRKLIIVGEGTEAQKLKAMAGPTVQLLGRVQDHELPPLYAKCRAFLFAADEDFGISPVEAQSYGRPVIAYGHGGSLETVRVADPLGRSDTGVYFPEQTAMSVMAGIVDFEARESKFSPHEIQEHARKFDIEIFKSEFQKYVSARLGGR